MKNSYDNMPNGYQETIEKGLNAVRYFNGSVSYGKGSKEEQESRLKTEIKEADAIVIGAGAGLSTSAGFIYSGERFEKYFYDFEEKYGFHDMYSGGFYVMQLEPEISWAYWARNIYINRYMKAPKPVYEMLLELVKEKDYFVITTNVDHQFQRAGFDKKRLFYTQGDYGLFQSVNPAIQKTFDNEEWVMKAMEAQGFIQDEAGVFQLPEDGKISMEIPSELIPKCPDDGSDMTMNLRADDSFVEDEGWHRASAAYSDFIRRHENLHVLYLELGVGANTPVIIKYPFWQMTLANEKAVYACVNFGESYCPEEIADRSICIDGDIATVL
ncbi:SIR2 family NAD-dependent protein deacylase [Lachnospira multipara]|uniref:NAD-dependent protein deacetylase, SIR2 family n=1 Tax=Lachnospira multipara TaxID=28051 RepID=A0A1H5S1M9_9FIRM|nr:NAD-dependent protein deacetylase, SIR2 family [Lachnospira multipara]